MRIAVLVACTASCLFSGVACAIDSSFVSGKVSRVWADNDANGGCMIKLNGPVQGEGGLTCGSGSWVHFNCNGEGGYTKAQGQTKFGIAQLAFVTDRRVRIMATDEVVINGRCFGKTIDVQ